jgi:predicted metal-binding protein
MAVTLHVCVTCRAGETVLQGEATPGARLYEAISGLGPLPGVTVKAVQCLSACTQGCSIALSAPGRWSYVYGRLGEADAGEIRAGAAAYARAADGIVPWRERSQLFRRQSLARIPPIPAHNEAAE